MKRKLSMTLAIILVVTSFAGCQSTQTTPLTEDVTLSSDFTASVTTNNDVIESTQQEDIGVTETSQSQEDEVYDGVDIFEGEELTTYPIESTQHEVMDITETSQPQEDEVYDDVNIYEGEELTTYQKENVYKDNGLYDFDEITQMPNNMLEFLQTNQAKYNYRYDGDNHYITLDFQPFEREIGAVIDISSGISNGSTDAVAIYLNEVNATGLNKNIFVEEDEFMNFYDGFMMSGVDMYIQIAENGQITIINNFEDILYYNEFLRQAYLKIGLTQ